MARSGIAIGVGSLAWLVAVVLVESGQDIESAAVRMNMRAPSGPKAQGHNDGT